MGCSITLALLGVRKDDVSRHVGWANARMVHFFNDLMETVKPALPSCASKGLAGELEDNHKAHIDISAFKPVVP